MSRSAPKLREFAQRLIAFDQRGNSAHAQSPHSFAVCDKLRPHLATLMGNAGFRALLTRALALANADVPTLHALHVNPEGSLAGLEDLAAEVDPADIVEARLVLVTQLLGLLIAFIGENLTFRFVREVWPKLPPH